MRVTGYECWAASLGRVKVRASSSPLSAQRRLQLPLNPYIYTTEKYCSLDNRKSNIDLWQNQIFCTQHTPQSWYPGQVKTARVLLGIHVLRDTLYRPVIGCGSPGGADLVRAALFRHVCGSKQKPSIFFVRKLPRDLSLSSSWMGLNLKKAGYRGELLSVMVGEMWLATLDRRFVG